MMPFPLVGLSTSIFLSEGFPLQSLTEGCMIFERYISKDPAQYIRLISFTPAANKPGELHRINILVIEIGSYLTKHNSSFFKL